MTRSHAGTTEGPDVRVGLPREPVPGRGWDWARSVGTVALVAGAVSAFFLSTYRLHVVETPIGWDVPKYLWRTSLAGEVGVHALPERVPPPVDASPDRPGFPILALTLSGVTGHDPYALAAAAAPLGAAAVGLAGGALWVVALRRPPWQGALLAAVLGTSSLVVRLAGPEAYLDNLFAGAVVLAALVPLSAVARPAGVAGGSGVAGGAGLAPALLATGLLIAVAVLHWATFLVFLAVLVLAVGWRSRGWFRRSAGDPSPGLRLAGVVLAALAGAALAYLALAALPNPPVVHEGEFARKLDDTLGRLDLLLLPLAVVGLVSWARRPTVPGRPGERFAVDVLVVWTALIGVAVATHLLGLRAVPAHRFLTLGLPLPILAFEGALLLGSIVAGDRSRAATGPAGTTVPPWRRWGAGTLVAAMLGAGAAQALGTWLDIRPAYESRKVAEGAQVAAYLEAARVPEDRTVVVVVEDRGGNPDFVVPLMAHTLRTQLPAERIARTHLYVGDPERYLAGKVTVLRRPGSELRDGVAWRFMRDLRPLLDDAPVAVITPAYNITFFEGWRSRHLDDRVAPDVAVVSGPPLDRPLPSVPSDADERLDAVHLAAVTLLAGLVLAGAGLGWTLAAGARLGTFPAVSLAPAAGLAAVVLAGLAVDRAGIRLTGGGAGLALALAAGPGYVALLLGRRRRPV
jgi:hypothetical protein